VITVGLLFALHRIIPFLGFTLFSIARFVPLFYVIATVDYWTRCVLDRSCVGFTFRVRCCLLRFWILVCRYVLCPVTFVLYTLFALFVCSVWLPRFWFVRLPYGFVRLFYVGLPPFAFTTTALPFWFTVCRLPFTGWFVVLRLVVYPFGYVPFTFVHVHRLLHGLRFVSRYVRRLPGLVPGFGSWLFVALRFGLVCVAFVLVTFGLGYHVLPV